MADDVSVESCAVVRGRWATLSTAEIHSAAGSSDVLAALGVDLTIPPERVAQVLDEVGITFAFAALFHPGFKANGCELTRRRTYGPREAVAFYGLLDHSGSQKVSRSFGEHRPVNRARAFTHAARQVAQPEAEPAAI